MLPARPSDQAKALLGKAVPSAGSRPGLQAGSAPSAAKPNTFTIIRQIVSAGGYTALFRGMMPTLLREVPGSCAYFTAYEGSKMYFASHQVLRLKFSKP